MAGYSSLSNRLEEYTTLVLSFIINGILYRRKDLASTDIRRIVIIKLDHIGDVILSIPAIASLRAHFPGAHITMVVNSSSQSIANLIPHVDTVICYDARFFVRSGRSKRFDFMRGLHFARDMRSREFGLIVDLRGSFASLLFALTARSKYRIDRGSYLIQRKLGWISVLSEHEAEVNLDMLARAGIVERSQSVSLTLPREVLATADSLLGSYNDAKSRLYTVKYPRVEIPKLVVIHPGGPYSLKRWPAEMYAQLARQILQEYNARIVLVGGKEEERITQAIASATNRPVTDLSGQTTLSQLAAIMQQADLFIGNDSAPMHLAAACGAKVIGLFGPTSPQRFGPYGERCIALRMERDCPPCMRDKCKLPGYRCIDRISVDDAMKVIRQML